LHGNVANRGLSILSVQSTDPLVISVSGLSGSAVGYDGVIASGSKIARGIIRSVSEEFQQLDHVGFWSYNDNFFLLGGVNSSGTYSRKLWHSTDGANFSITDLELPFSGSKFSRLVGSGSYVYAINGIGTNGSLQSVYSGTINTVTRKIDWAPTPVMTGVIPFSGVFNVAYNVAANEMYTSTGIVSLSVLTSSARTLGSVNHHSGVLYYDPNRKVLWTSNTGSRSESVIGINGKIYEQNVTKPWVYTHLQTTPATTWIVTHNMGAAFNTAVLTDLNYQVLEPLTLTVTATTLTATFTSASTGGAFIMSGAAMAGTTWIYSASHYNQPFLAVSSGTILDPATVSYSGFSGTFLTLTFNSSSTGHLISLLHPLSGNAGHGINDYNTGYKKIIGTTFSTTNTLNIQQYHFGLPWMRLSSTMEYMEPKAVGYSAAGTTVTLNSASLAILYSMDVRHLNMHNLQDPWDKTGIKSASLGWNANNHQYVYVVTDNTVWYSFDGGAYWEEMGTDVFADKGTYIVANNPTVGAMSSSYVQIRSVDNGETFTSGSSAVFGQQNISWYGALKEIPNTSWKFFAYVRPSDVIFETDYGAFDDAALSGVLDDYSTNYVLPYDTLISAGDLNSVTFSVSSSFSRSFVADEFNKDFLKIHDASATASFLYEIDRNSSAGVGDSVTIYLRDELPFTPEASLDKIQIVKRRDEGIEYYSVITRDTNINAYIYNEASGSRFIPDKEQAFDWYAHDVIRDGLPSAIATEDNLNRANLLATETNRQRTLSDVSFNDPERLPPALLKRLGTQYGLDLDENLPLSEQRRAITLWHSRVNQFGACIEGIGNLSNLVFGSGSLISGTTGNPSSNTVAGMTLTLNVSAYANTAFTWTASNARGFDSNRQQWYLEGSTDQLSSDLQFMTHQNVVVINKSFISDPVLIDNHISEVTGIRLYFNDSATTSLPLENNVSKVLCFDESRMRKLYFFVDRVKKIVPSWVTIIYT
jgi:hypothetical protein